jgi:putative copper export protein
VARTVLSEAGDIVRDASLDAEAIRVFLHVFAVSVWLGGQIVVGGIMPGVHKAAPDAMNVIAKGFGRVAWPAFGIAVFTGVWNMVSVDSADTTSGWSALLGIKMLLVVIAGIGAWLHQVSSKPAIKGMSAGLALVASIVAALFGVMLSN